jgi:hypothetical protein
LDTANLRGLIHTSTGQIVSAPATLKGCDLVESISILVAHRTELEARLEGAAPSFDFAVSHKHGDAAEHSQAGFTRSSTGFELGNGSATSSKDGKKLTADQQILAARGVKSYAELSEKMSNGTIPNPATEKLNQKTK